MTTTTTTLDPRAALEALVTRLDAVHADPTYAAVWAIAQNHVGPYAGPTYVAELDAARKALAPAPLPAQGDATDLPEEIDDLINELCEHTMRQGAPWSHWLGVAQSEFSQRRAALERAILAYGRALRSSPAQPPGEPPPHYLDDETEKLDRYLSGLDWHAGIAERRPPIRRALEAAFKAGAAPPSQPQPDGEARARHIYQGRCPDEANGWSSRDPECPACRWLDQPQPDEMRRQVEELAIEWEQEAERRIRDSKRPGEPPSSRRQLVLGAAFERGHAARLRSLLSAAPAPTRAEAEAMLLADAPVAGVLAWDRPAAPVKGKETPDDRCNAELFGDRCIRSAGHVGQHESAPSSSSEPGKE